MRKEIYLKFRFVLLIIILFSVFIIGYNLVHKYQLPYNPADENYDEMSYYYLQKKDSENLVNINTATKKELMILPYVGDATADKIIQLRNDLGRFSSEKQLLHIDGISDEKFEIILPYITIE